MDNVFQAIRYAPVADAVEASPNFTLFEVPVTSLHPLAACRPQFTSLFTVLRL